MKTKTCEYCGGSFGYSPKTFEGSNIPEMFAPKNCPPCSRLLSEKQKFDDDLKKKAGRELTWLAMCPPIYRNTDVARLPESAKKVLGWKLNPKGLMIAGDTGKGKTRAAFLVMEKLHLEGCSMEIFHGNAFAHQCAINFGEMNGEKWIAELARRKVVFFDDLGKFKMTERVEAELFGLIEMRIANLLPVIVTTNLSGEDLKSKMTSDRGEPLVRRLREFCEVVLFS